MLGVIAAGHSQTAAAGAEMLKMGGNAVDAAVAAAFASFVVESSLVNIGGGGIAQVFSSNAGQATVYDFFSNMPGLSPNNGTSPHHLDFRKILVNFGSALQPFYIGRGSVAVPGAVAGLCQMIDERGTLSLSQILAPAIRMARDGVVLTEAQAFTTELLKPILTDTPEIAAIYAPGGEFISPGQTLYFSALADTLEQLAQAGALLFYTGSVAQKILADQQAYNGLLTETDLTSYSVFQTAPIRIDYRGYTVLLPPPSSGGGALIAFGLKLLATIPLSKLSHNGFEHIRILSEAMRLTNMARAEWEGNMDNNSNSTSGKGVETLLSDSNIRNYRRILSKVLAHEETVVETNTSKGPANTTHISVADADGTLVSITTSAGENAGFIVGDTGVMLNNMLGETDLHPNGFHRLPPGQRIMTMMSPTLVLHQGRPILAVGSGGSNRLRSAILQVISNVLDFEMPLAEAVEAPRMHFEENELQLEGGIAPQVADQFQAAGYSVNQWPQRNMFFGGTHAVAYQSQQNDASPSWVAAGDPRRGGAVIEVK